MEEFRVDIKGYEKRYKVSNLGRVISLSYKRSGEPKIIKQQLQQDRGYLTVSICKNGKYLQTVTHRIVAQMFIPNPHNKTQVNHKNGIKTDNRIDNLEWCTPSENHLHKFSVLGYKHPQKQIDVTIARCSKRVAQYNRDGTFIKFWASATEASRDIGVCRSNIRDCCRGTRMSAGGYIWKHYN